MQLLPMASSPDSLISARYAVKGGGGVLEFMLLLCGVRPPPGWGGGRHLVTVTPGVGKNHRPWGGGGGSKRKSLVQLWGGGNVWHW